MNRLTKLQQRVGWPAQKLCEAVELPCATVRRWKQRHRQGRPAVEKPGPKPVAPVDLDQLRQRVRGLDHHRQRSHGVGALYGQIHDQISRREFQALVEQARLELHREQRTHLRHVIWHGPGLVWSLDDSELVELRPHAPHRIYLHQVSDQASRYRLRPMLGPQLHGEQVAANLQRLFAQHGAPLLLKRDNGGNLNHRAVQAVLAKWLVLPLNSPPEYPPYNGGIERAQREMTETLLARIAADRNGSRYCWPLHAENSAHECNHRPRECLGGRCSCERFATRQQTLRMYHRRRRREIYETIENLATALWHAPAGNKRRTVNVVWRLAVETWLQKEGVITITQNQKVLPSFPENIAHN